MIPSFIFMAAMWEFVGPGKLYHCSDPFPIFNFFPPFVHTAPQPGYNTGDYFIAPEWVVWTVWAVFMVVVCVLPLVILKLSRLEKRLSNLVQQ